MILLDTNVVSELMRSEPAPRLLDWFAALLDETLALTAVTAAELRYGVLILPDGSRRRQLDRAVTAMLAEDFSGLILPFDAAAAEAYGLLAARYRRLGLRPGQSDTMIAAIALSRGAAVATRNLRDFAESGLVLHDPFAGPADG